MNYYKRHIGDYMKDAGHLSLLEHGVYMRMLDVYYTREGPIPVDQAARLIGARSRDEKAALETIASEFFDIVDGCYTQTRCDEEIEKMRTKAETNREVGKRGGRPKKETQTVTESDDSGNPKKTQTVSGGLPEKTLATSHKPLANNQEETESSDTTPRSNARGARLPSDWKPSEQDVAYCQTERPDLNPERVAEAFRDYWHSKAGADARRASWPATWRNWVRNERPPQARASPNHRETLAEKRARCAEEMFGDELRRRDENRIIDIN